MRPSHEVGKIVARLGNALTTRAAMWHTSRMAWKRLTVEWLPTARAELLDLAIAGQNDLAESIAHAVAHYAETGTGNAIEMIGPWRGWCRLRPAGLASNWRVVFKHFKRQHLLRIDRVRPRPVVYLDPPC